MTRPINYPFASFRPHPLLRSGHAQTVAGVYLPGKNREYRARRHHVTLPDGDQIVLHDDCPVGWHPGDRVALLIHGLAGCHESGYMQRIAHKLGARGIRAFRMDLRGCGAGQALALLPYHSGRSEDAAAAVEAIARLAPRSPVTLVGFSLGGNIVLKLAGELAQWPCGHLDSVMAVCPPVDLPACSENIRKRINRLYDRYFVGRLMQQVAQRQRVIPEAPAARFPRPPRSLWEFDNMFTAVVWGFGTADNYYSTTSAAPHLSNVRIPTLILSSRDDPVIPIEVLERTERSSFVQLHLTNHGGHLGFIGRRGADADRRWMDWRVVEWVVAASRRVSS